MGIITESRGSKHRMNAAVGSSQLMRAIMIILFAIFLFDVMGAIIKYLGNAYSSQQLAVMRNLFGIIPSLLVLWYTPAWHSAGRPLKIRQWKLGLFRGLLITIAQFCFYLALVSIEFATATTIAFAGPMFVTALSIPILGLKVGIWRWLAVFIGFAGIVMVVQPGSDAFSWYALLPLGAAFGYGAASVTARLFDDDVSTALVNMYSILAALFATTVLAWSTASLAPVVSLHDWLWLLAMGMCGGTAVFCLIYAYRLVEPSLLSPFEYFGIPFSFFLGWVFFAEAPFERLFPGVLLIVAAGLLIVWREQKNQE
ncbi:MAG: DMT family transporter [Thiolinea sp.]